MNCSCRITALRIFVRTIAQGQIPSVTTASSFAQATASFGGRRPSQLTAVFPVSECQPFHTTRANWGQASPDAQTPNANESVASMNLTTLEPTSQDGAKTSSAPTWADLRKKALAKTKTNKRARSKEGKKTDDQDDELAQALQGRRKPSLIERIAEEHDEGRDTENWKVQKVALKGKFPEGWQPRKKLSPDALAGIRALHAEFPKEYTTEVLADKFEVSPEAIRRILRSKWTPSPEEEIERQERWFRRGKSVWSRWAEMGVKPPRRWRAEGIVRDPIWHQKKSDETEAKKARARAHNLLSETVI